MAKTTQKNLLIKYITIENILFILALSSIVFYLVFQTVILQTANPQVAVTTTSMVPTYEGYDFTQLRSNPQQYYDIFKGDLLIVFNIEPHVGDVIIFTVQTQSTPIVHRVVSERIDANGTRYFSTKGDHNPWTDTSNIGNNFGWIPRSDVLGVVVFDIHHIGWLSLQLQEPFVKALLVVTVLALIVLSFYDSFTQDEKDKSESTKNTDQPRKRKVFFKFKNRKWRVNRPRLYAYLIFFVILSMYLGFGFLDFGTHTNTVQWIQSNSDEKNNIINLRSTTENVVENLSNVVIYNTLIQINSSGTLNFVNKIVITPIFNNISLKSPDYVWTIVYDYAGSKIIHAAISFNVPQNISDIAIDTTLKYEVYSAGLLASGPSVTTQNVIVLI